ncbi:4-(cytidine 5'-diphospho)-2-C-methyl-D-erythritol kinase [Thermosediminibacter oceani]|uniref:4-diphosphocytidyl-2-C-methyl-D-erythritol kinase n=1 Tax=Thermosediminibacter oceani (strain ATCC BAA-1034 / DSM 16646 / JW/IW-1228P) TaxID=555079 RepID=D9RZE2_THEOJ|nr:4-(cytidine 5'-diphospho)-2-C-methyl-D-erythritol kinase [Thermosediminibacter oceani]ADL06840.1 4-diphosphocytidyl-2-C-methyl-D-erythritol kinase [Thermosediminibacter oceani DSM 16646]
MDKVELEARAKINLTLDVLYRRSDGYHEVEMIMQTISLKDRIVITLIPEKGIRIVNSCRELPDGEDNLAFKAAKLMMDEYGLDAGVEIKLFKEIPIAAGLAGGSADAAAVLEGLNELFGLGLPKEALMRLGEMIGADVPFCTMGGTALARGKGEKLTPLPPVPPMNLLLVKPPFAVSTREVYNRLKIDSITKRPDTEAVIRSIEKGDVDGISRGLCNVLEEVTFAQHPELGIIKAWLVERGAMGSLMSGSGPTVYGIFENRRDAERAAASMPLSGCRIFISQVD